MVVFPIIGSTHKVCVDYIAHSAARWASARRLRRLIQTELSPLAGTQVAGLLYTGGGYGRLVIIGQLDL